MEDRRIAPRHAAKLQAQLRSYLLFDEVGNTDLEEEMVMVGAQTFDVSESGVALVVPQKGLDANTLSTLMGRTLQIVLELPTGTIGIEAITMRHQLLEIDGQMKYLIGAQISEMEDYDREIYNAFLAAAETAPS
ncbi:MAG: hypothetical protein WKF30_15655 [Pyrinomonadaceae bacterium]